MINVIRFTIIAIFLILFELTPSKAGSFLSRDTTTLASNVNSLSLPSNQSVEFSNVLFPLALEPNRAHSLEYIRKFSEKKRQYLIHMHDQGRKIFPKVTAIFKRFNLPSELRVLIALESGFNANAISKAGAVGYWQIMDEVAREYGLKVIPADQKLLPSKTGKDERTNFNKSTSAAAKYLKDRCKNLDNNILLIVASYNWGVGHIKEVMRKTGKSNPTFWDIKKYLPAETRNYVMNFISLNVIFLNYKKFEQRSLVFTPHILPFVRTTEGTLPSDSALSLISTD